MPLKPIKLGGKSVAKGDYKQVSLSDVFGLEERPIMGSKMMGLISLSAACGADKCGEC
jgi:hypothetical protein|tara:strand:- start:1893 stop:2066 length:174 start_codon:yes stop_codon:yes gene_type:complete